MSKILLKEFYFANLKMSKCLNLFKLDESLLISHFHQISNVEISPENVFVISIVKNKYIQGNIELLERHKFTSLDAFEMLLKLAEKTVKIFD